MAAAISLHGPGSPVAEAQRSMEAAMIVPPCLRTREPMLAPPQMGRFGGFLSVPSPLKSRLVAAFSGVPVSEYEPSPFTW